MHALLPRVATYAVTLSFTAWLSLSIVTVVGRARYDRFRGVSPAPVGRRAARRLSRRVRTPARTDRGAWRRIEALDRLVRSRHPASLRLVRSALADPDERLAAAAVRALGDLGDDWAVDLLIETLREGHVPRSRVASQLEHLAPRPGMRLLPLLRDRDPAVRFWAATLIAPYPELGEERLVMMTHDRDPDVRAAAVQTLGTRSGAAARSAILASIDDPVWFVRVHAARSAGVLLGAAAAPSLVHVLADTRWWVRMAAKDALRGIGTEAVPALLATLNDADAFARNGAAEVLQDIGFVDSLAHEHPTSPLLERIYAAGGENMRRAADERAAGREPTSVERAA